jgi:hypothetical protein
MMIITEKVWKFGRVKALGNSSNNRKYIYDEIKRLNSGSAWYYSVHRIKSLCCNLTCCPV